MKSPAHFITLDSGELYTYEVRYLNGTGGEEHTHRLDSKNVRNALKSFARAVPGCGRIMGIKKVVPE